MGAHRPGQACTCCSHRDGSHPLIVLIRYSERGDLQGPQRLRRCTGAPRCLFHLPASVFESDPLIYPATLFWRRFGCAGLVGGILFSAKFICMGKSGVGPGFDSRPYKKCAHFAHFAENHCRVARDPRTLGAVRPGLVGAPWGQPERGQRRTHRRPSGPAYPTQDQPDLDKPMKSSRGRALRCVVSAATGGSHSLPVGEQWPGKGTYEIATAVLTQELVGVSAMCGILARFFSSLNRTSSPTATTDGPTNQEWLYVLALIPYSRCAYP